MSKYGVFNLITYNFAQFDIIVLDSSLGLSDARILANLRYRKGKRGAVGFE
jgi:hypothetical protein